MKNLILYHITSIDIIVFIIFIIIIIIIIFIMFVLSTTANLRSWSQIRRQKVIQA